MGMYICLEIVASSGFNPDSTEGQWAIDVQDNYELLKRYSHGFREGGNILCSQK